MAPPWSRSPRPDSKERQDAACALAVAALSFIASEPERLGRFLALTGILIALTYWRTREGFLRHAFATNAVVMACGFLLVGYQLAGYFLPPV